MQQITLDVTMRSAVGCVTGKTI